jgi:putative Mg2+ transporter-C (MgtC) family protein
MRSPELTIVDFLLRLGVAALCGVAIGFERQWRQRSTGLHTSTLVAIGSALFALLDQIIGAGDTTRIVAGVVTGVGFIAGGVILRQGLTVTGLNTAATIWATAAVGAIAGFGLWPQAAAGAVAIIGFNLCLQPLAEFVNARAWQRQEGETVYKISITCENDAQSAIGEAILNAVSGSNMSLQSLTRHLAEGRNIELRADVFAPKPESAKIDRLSAALLSIPGVHGANWESTEP